jgi:cytosine/uracil/thiamine/allantoin permease
MKQLLHEKFDQGGLLQASISLIANPWQTFENLKASQLYL